MAEGWTATDNRRMLHVVYRVGDLPRTVKFYKEQLGMQVRWLCSDPVLQEHISCFAVCQRLREFLYRHIALHVCWLLWVEPREG